MKMKKKWSNKLGNTQRAMSQHNVIYANGPGQDKCVFSRSLLASTPAPWILIENNSLLLDFKAHLPMYGSWSCFLMKNKLWKYTSEDGSWRLL